MVLGSSKEPRWVMGRWKGCPFLAASALVIAVALLSVGFRPAEGTHIGLRNSPSSTAWGIPIGLWEPFDYASIPAGTPILLDLSGGGFTSVRISLDQGPAQLLPAPYRVDTSDWGEGTRHLRVEVFQGTNVVGVNTFVFFIDPTATWPPDTMSVDVILIGFDVGPSDVAPSLLQSFLAPTLLTSDPTSQHTFSLKFNFRVSAADAAYSQAFQDAMRAEATFRADVQGRLNLTALIDQRDTGTKRDIFDPLLGWEIPARAAEQYVERNPPVAPWGTPGYTYYVMNLSGLDNPANGTDHWFVRPSPDPDTGVDEDWWRLEWDNALNTPMGYPMNAFGGPDHKVFLDPTAYQWYIDWAYVWWQGGNGSAPYGRPYEEIPPAERGAYLADQINDLNAGLAAELPMAPPQSPTIEVRTFVLSGSTNRTMEELRWAYNGSKLGDYLQEFLPFKTIVMNTTFASVDDYPALKVTIDRNTTYRSGWGYIDGANVWTYLIGNRSLYAVDRPGVFQILTMNVLYDNRSMVFNGREFTGIGGGGVTAIFMTTGRLYYGNGTRAKGLTTIVSHETGHSLGFGHQFGPDYRADFIDGNMGYFRNELTYGTFYEDALYRVYLRAKVFEVLRALESKWPIDLRPEFTGFYGHYRDLRFTEAYSDLQLIERSLSDTIPPTAQAGGDRSASRGEAVSLDASASLDNYRIVNYSWDFGDGTSVVTASPYAQKAWTSEGVFTVTLTVTDVAGNRDSAQFLVTVGPGPEILPWIAIGVVVAAVAIVALLWIRRKRWTPRP